MNPSEFSLRRLAVSLVMIFCFLLSLEAAPGPGAQAVLANAEALELTEAQIQEIRAIMKDTVAEFNRVSRAERGQAGLSEKLNEIRAGSQEKALKVLDAHQRDLWSGLSAKKTDPKEDEIAARSLIIPSIEELRNPPRQGAFGPSTAISETRPHPIDGDGYVILTDHEDPVVVAALARLAKARGGTVLEIESLGELHLDEKAFERLQEDLREQSPRFVAIAPRPQSYRENMHLGVLRLLSGLDEDPELDAFPGYLVASDPAAFAAMIDRILAYEPIARDQIKPVSIGVIEDQGVTRYRSYQKAKVIQKWLAEDGLQTPSIIISTRKEHAEREDFPELPQTEIDITMLTKQPKETFATFSSEATDALDANNVLFMFGHGTTNRICGTGVTAYAPIDFTDEVVFCGSCMSASPYQADRVDLSGKEEETRFAYQAVENGAVAVFGHMGLCGGFPKLYPMAELALDGLTCGEAYQRLMNALIGGRPIPDYYPSPAPRRASPRDPRNNLLYVLWGDPSLVFARP